DSKNRFWVGCINGLQQFNRQTNQFDDIKLLSANNQLLSTHITSIIESKDGNIWISTSGEGVLRMTKDRDKTFRSVTYLNSKLLNQYLTFIFQDSSGKFWIGSENYGLNLYDPDKDKMYVFSVQNNKIGSNQISAITEDSKKNIFVGTLSGGLYKFNKNDFSFISIKDANGNSNQPVKTIFLDKNNRLLVGTDGQGLKTYNYQKNLLEDMEIKSAPFDFSKTKVHAILQDRAGNLWFGLFQKGVFLVRNNPYAFNYIGHKSFSQNLIGSNSIASILQDRNNELWVGTDNDGMYRLEKNFKNSVHYNPPAVPNIVSSIVELDNGEMWLGSFSQGLASFNKNTGKSTYFNNIPSSFQYNNLAIKINCMIKDQNDNLWIGTHGGGLFVFDPSTRKYIKHFGSDVISNDWISSLFMDKDQRIWIGTYDNGINLVEENQGKISFIHNFKNYPFEESSKVRCLSEGYKGQIWVATTNGLVTFNPDSYNPNQIKFSRYVKSATDKSSLNSNDVLFICKDSEDKIWLSTAGGGLNLAMETQNNQLKFKNFTKENGLPSDFILSMVEDDEKNLWLATENGISKFNIKHQTFRNYDTYDGLLKTRFSEASSLKLQNGNLIFGCKIGYLNFNPQTIKNQKSTTQMVFTNFEVNNKISNVKSAEFPLKQDINYDNNIELDYQHNTISIYYTVLDYRSNNKQLYAYRLKGLEDTWHQVKNQKKATFTNLDPGDYEFEVKCLNTDLYTNVPQKKLSFTITPPFWKTNWAYFLYAIIFLALLEMSRRIVYSMIQLRNKVVVEHQMTELKLSFFTNISHELRTPLTLIVNPIEEIAKNENLSPLGNEYIETVRKNADRLVRFVNQLLDFRKVQSGNEELHIAPIEMVTFINETITLFVHIAHEKNIKIQTKSNFGSINANLDKEKIDIVIYNLLSNALKFSPNDSVITVELALEKDNFLKIYVVDQGTGVDENKLEDIFKLYYETNTGKNKNVGTGIGLALCKEYVQLHQGSIYAVNNTDGGLTVAITIDLNNELLQSHSNTIASVAQKNQKQPLVIAQNNENVAVENDTNLPLVLIVEDNNELRKFLKSQLQCFYRIIEAENGKVALEIATKKLPDLILSDIMMPEMDGIELLDALKNSEETSHIPVVLLTAKSSVESKIEGLNYGADYYITKPFDTDFLLASIENLIKQRKKFFENLQANVKTMALEPSEIIITTKDEQFLKDSIAIVENNLTNPKFNIDVISNSLSISRVTFNRKFKSLTNMTPVEFVREMRIKRAKQFLDAGETDIAGIAYKVGFNDAGYFSTCFKEYYKIAPSDYLKQKQE
ncbi:MAG TPA: two-component regulator propeller domain-containing protein, partial [Flavobacterium alvei]|nr:two-component regulator propeller domain-containing protein [Flavobacterium alvei]